MAKRTISIDEAYPVFSLSTPTERDMMWEIAEFTDEELAEIAAVFDRYYHWQEVISDREIAARAEWKKNSFAELQKIGLAIEEYAARHGMGAVVWRPHSDLGQVRGVQAHIDGIGPFDVSFFEMSRNAGNWDAVFKAKIENARLRVAMNNALRE